MIIHGKHTGSIQELAKRLQDCPVSVRWGGQFVKGAINGECHLLTGLEQLLKLYEAKLPAVEFTEDEGTVRKWLAEENIVFGRKLHHTQGKDILKMTYDMQPSRRDLNKFMERDYWTKYEESVREWRFHVLKGKSIARSLKFWANGDKEPKPPYIRSRRLGWHMCHDVDPPKGIRSLAKAACEAVGYDLGAVDILELPGQKFKILEINSRPAIRDEYTINAYVRAFRQL